MAITTADMENLISIVKAAEIATSGAPAIQQFTITGASDWPMFEKMLWALVIVFTGAWTTIIGLLLYIYNGIMSRIGKQRKEDAEGCKSCKKAIWDHISGPVWTAIEGCLPGMSETEKLRLQSAIQRETQGISDA